MSEEGLRASVEKMRSEGVAGAAIRAFEHYYRQLEAGETGLMPEDSIEPVTDPVEFDALPSDPDAEREAYVGDYQFEGFVMHLYLKDGDVWARVNDPAGEKLVYLGDGVFGGTEEPDLRLELRGPKLTMRYYGVRVLAERLPN